MLIEYKLIDSFSKSKELLKKIQQQKTKENPSQIQHQKYRSTIGLLILHIFVYTNRATDV